MSLDVSPPPIRATADRRQLLAVVAIVIMAIAFIASAISYVIADLSPGGSQVTTVLIVIGLISVVINVGLFAADHIVNRRVLEDVKVRARERDEHLAPTDRHAATF